MAYQPTLRVKYPLNLELDQPSSEGEVEEPRPVARTIKRQELIDDFIRNFFISHGLDKSLEAFQGEWYEVAQRGKLESNEEKKIPDVVLRNLKMNEKIEALQREVQEAQSYAEKYRETKDQLTREKGHHLKQYHRVRSEKKLLTQDIATLKRLHEDYESKYLELSMKYQAAMKEKMLVKMDRDKLRIETEQITKSIKEFEKKFNLDKGEEGDDEFDQEQNLSLKNAKQTVSRLEETGKVKKRRKGTLIPKNDEQNPYLTTTFDPFPTKNLNMIKNFKAHKKPITALTVHPNKAFVATGSDNTIWKIWQVPSGEEILESKAEEHKDWISDIEFSPNNTHLATSSGDSTVKVWDFIKHDKIISIKAHQRPVWSISFHHTGKFLVSGSMDMTSRLLDIKMQKAVTTFRGHVDSINKIKFIPYSNIFVSASADKTISLWDIRSGLCVQTFYGHLNCINGLDINCRGEAMASCDADGIVKVWDLKKNQERLQIDSGEYSANSVAFDKAGGCLAIACDDHFIRLANADSSEGGIDSSLAGHESPVKSVAFEYSTKHLVSCSEDGEMRIWA